MTRTQIGIGAALYAVKWMGLGRGRDHRRCSSCDANIRAALRALGRARR